MFRKLLLLSFILTTVTSYTVGEKIEKSMENSIDIIANDINDFLFALGTNPGIGIFLNKAKDFTDKFITKKEKKQKQLCH